MAHYRGGLAIIDGKDSAIFCDPSRATADAEVVMAALWFAAFPIAATKD
jgi:hypothetical protein